LTSDLENLFNKATHMVNICVKFIEIAPLCTKVSCYAKIC